MSDDVQTFRNRVLELLNYNFETGIFTRKIGRGGKEKGSVAGTRDKDGYVVIVVDRKSCKAHRLAWLVTTGKNPIAEIDHIDGNKAINSFSNLREATSSQNMCNRRMQRNNTTGFIGVSRDAQRHKGYAYVKKDRVKYNLGCFDNPRDAAISRDKAAIRLHGEFSRLNFNYVIDEEGNVELDE